MTNPIRDEDLEALMYQFEVSDLAEMHVRIGDFQLYLTRNGAETPPWKGLADSGSGGASSGGTSGRRSDYVSQSSAGPTPPPTSEMRSAYAASAAVAPLEVTPGFEVVRAPYLGTFYRSPKPGEPPFCEIGDTVEPGRDLCLIEVMKLFTAVRANSKGIVRHVYAVDGQLVQESQPLFALEPVE